MKAVWTWLDGKKTVIALTGTLVLAWLSQRQMIPDDVYQLCLSIATAWGVIGIGDKVRKGMR